MSDSEVEDRKRLRIVGERAFREAAELARLMMRPVGVRRGRKEWQADIVE